MSRRLIKCDVCGFEFEGFRVRPGSDGLVRCRSCQHKRNLEHKINYNKSDKGRISYEKYRGTFKQICSMNKHKKTDKYKIYRKNTIER